MTVVPQQYTLHCVTTGDGVYSIALYGNNQQIYSGACVCVKQLLHSRNYTYDNAVTITWDTQTISSGQSFSHSVYGDQMYRCNVVRYGNTIRDRHLTAKGIKLFLTYLQYIF